MKDYNKTIVISAVNLVNGGTFTILKECLQQISASKYFNDYKIIALVHSKLILKKYENIEYIEYPMAKKNYMFRLFYEYIYFYILSLKYRPEIWFSLHDITPNVKAKCRYVYMHNPSPFYKHFKDENLSLKFNLFTHLYKFLYKINAKKNTAVIVQQQWIRTEIAKLCHVPLAKIIVAYPEIKERYVSSNYEKHLFFFPSFPREFKNFEIICEAVSLLELELLQNIPWLVILTIDGSENAYSKRIVDMFGKLQHIQFAGILNTESMYEIYNRTECLIFPSKLETWGLPISEFKVSYKKMILADLPYAHETAHNAKQVVFFNVNCAAELANFMKKVIMEDCKNTFIEAKDEEIFEPFCASWSELLKKIAGV